MKLSKIIFIIAIFIFTANSVQAKKITPKRETVARIVTRNEIAQKHISKAKDIKTNDLFNLILDHPEYFIGGDGVHPIDKGYQVLAEQVAKKILESLSE